MRILSSRFLYLSCVQLSSLRQSLNKEHGCSSPHVAQMLQVLEVSSNSNRPNWFRTFCSKKDLSIKKCVPCNSEVLRPMSEESANKLLLQVPEWSLVNEGGVLKLHRSWTVKTFTKGLEFFQVVGSLAEEQGHHPDLHLVGWNNVKIDVWTHSVAGLTENDFILAAKINGLNVHHLLRGEVGKRAITVNLGASQA